MRHTRRRSVFTWRRGLRGAPPIPRWIWMVGTVLVVVFLAVVVRSIQRRDALTAWRAALEEGRADTSWPEWASSWPLLPTSRNSRAGDLRGPYAFAALNAQTLRHIPCYCGCVREGHGSVLNCFVREFTSAGTPVWTDHGFTCPLCVDILREVSLMTSRGMSARAMRDSIERHHGSVFSRPTFTPEPH